MTITRGPVAAVGVLVATTALGLALFLFAPWTLFIDEQVFEALPVPEASAPPPGSPALDEPLPPTSPEPSAPSVQAGPVELARGELVSHEHTTTGTARVLQLDDGRRVLRLEGLDTSNGPDLHVWLADAPVIEGRAGWFLFDDGEFVDLGELRGNQGDANYEIPADVDLDGLTSVSIWCERFAVSFGAAALREPRTT